MRVYKTILIGNNVYSTDWKKSLKLIEHKKNIIFCDFENSDEVKKIILEKNIFYILVLSDTDYILISNIQFTNNVKILYPNKQIQELLNNKNLFTDFMLKKYPEYIPEIYYLDNNKLKDIVYPAIYKPVYSTNGSNMKILHNHKDFLNLKDKNNIQKFIEDQYEYSAYILGIDGIILNFKIIRYKFKKFYIKKRNFRKNYENVELFDMSVFKNIIGCLNYSGGICIDFKFDSMTKHLYIFEINPRFGGTAFSCNFIYQLLCIV